MSARWVQWVLAWARELIDGHRVCQHRASHESCKLTFHPSAVTLLLWMVLHLGESWTLFCHLRFLVSPLQNTLYTLLQGGCQIQSRVSHWTRRAVFPCRSAGSLCRGFDTWRAQTCLDALHEGVRRDLDWRESVRYAFAHRGKQTCRQPIAFTWKPQSIILNGT